MFNVTLALKHEQQNSPNLIWAKTHSSVLTSDLVQLDWLVVLSNGLAVTFIALFPHPQKALWSHGCWKTRLLDQHYCRKVLASLSVRLSFWDDNGNCWVCMVFNSAGGCHKKKIKAPERDAVNWYGCRCWSCRSPGMDFWISSQITEDIFTAEMQSQIKF